MDSVNFVEFKGTKDGLVIHLNESTDFEMIKNQLIDKLEQARNFFKGAKVASIEGKVLTQSEEYELKSIINTRFGMTTVEKNLNYETKDEVFQGIEEGMTKFISSTLRSGRKVEFNGNLVIMGDVNPGAVVTANGNIVIMGTLRGVAHAGANGNEQAFVAALKFQPTQLRIGKYIARAPDNNHYKPEYPEIALVKDGQILIRPYLIKNR